MTRTAVPAGQDVAFQSISEVGALLRDRKLSCVELTNLMLDRISALNPVLNCYGLVTADRARGQAQSLDQLLAAGVDLGPLHGIPVAVKDNIDTAFVPTTMGSKIMADRVPSSSAHVVERLEHAGAVLLGKLNLYEWAYGGVSTLWGPAKNPWDVAVEPGSSSSGSAVAVAAGLAHASIGTDTGGSIRKPAGMCGVLGLSPTHGRVSRRGVFPVSPSLDRVGPLARTSIDACIVLEAIAGPDPRERTTSAARVEPWDVRARDGIAGLRIGVMSPQQGALTSPVVTEMLASVVASLESLGASIQSLDLPSFDDARDLMWLISGPEVSDVHRKLMRASAELYSPTVITLLQTAEFIPATAYVRGQRVRQLMIEAMLRVFRSVDALVVPNLATPPWRLDQPSIEIEGVAFDPRGLATLYHPLFNLTGNPAAAVLGGFTQEGLPLSFQVVGPLFDESVVFRVAHAFEESAQLYQRHPDLRVASSNA